MILLMVVIVVIAISAQAVVVGTGLARRDSEEALLAAGEELRLALVSYQRAGGSALRSGPHDIADLLRDPRQPGMLRHLRHVPVDPLTGSTQWGLVRDGAGQIVAFHSLAPGQPQKREGFEPAQAGFENAESYAQWLFGALPVTR